MPDDCLFCRLYREGDHVRKGDGFVALRDIAPQAPTHLLVIPERHVDTFRDIGDLDAEEAKGLLGFVADTAREAGLEDYRVVVNVGPGGYTGLRTGVATRVAIGDGEDVTAEIRRIPFDTMTVSNAISARGLPGDVYRAATVRTGKLVR